MPAFSRGGLKIEEEELARKKVNKKGSDGSVLSKVKRRINQTTDQKEGKT
jgi:hypothetical protein